jgi:hypothetical protein
MRKFCGWQRKSRFRFAPLCRPKTLVLPPADPKLLGQPATTGCQHLGKNRRPDVAVNAAFRDATSDKQK